MSTDASVTLPWADGDYTFRLGWGDLIKLQEERDAGPFAILRRLMSENWRLEDISAVMRLSLVGGGVEPSVALQLVRDYVETRPPLENLSFARGILANALHGPADENLGEPAPPGEEADNS